MYLLKYTTNKKKTKSIIIIMNIHWFLHRVMPYIIENRLQQFVIVNVKSWAKHGKISWFQWTKSILCYGKCACIVYTSQCWCVHRQSYIGLPHASTHRSQLECVSGRRSHYVQPNLNENIYRSSNMNMHVMQTKSFFATETLYNIVLCCRSHSLLFLFFFLSSTPTVSLCHFALM